MKNIKYNILVFVGLASSLMLNLHGTYNNSDNNLNHQENNFRRFIPESFFQINFDDPELKIFLANEQKINYLTPGGNMELISYCKNGYIESVKLLLSTLKEFMTEAEIATYVNHVDEFGFTALYYAVLYRNIPLVKELNKYKADWTTGNFVENVRRTPMSLVIYFENKELYDLMVSGLANNA